MRFVLKDCITILNNQWKVLLYKWKYIITKIYTKPSFQLMLSQLASLGIIPNFSFPSLYHWPLSSDLAFKKEALKRFILVNLFRFITYIYSFCFYFFFSIVMCTLKKISWPVYMTRYGVCHKHKTFEIHGPGILF